MRRKTALIIAVMHAKYEVLKLKPEKEEFMLKRDSNRQPPLRFRCRALLSKMCYEASWELVTF